MKDTTQRDDVGAVEVRLPNGVHHTLFHGDLIGRLWSAALRLDDARVSEAHAMVSNRGRDMKLLALRGRFQIDGRTCTEVALRPGQDVVLAPGLVLHVLSVTTPRRVLRIRTPGLTPREVPGVLSLFGGPTPSIRTGWRPEAHGCIWPTGDGWLRSGSPPIDVVDGDSWCLEGATFTVSLEDGDSSVAPTQRSVSGLEPLTILARFDTVHLQRTGHPVVVLTGRSARMVSELVTLGQPLGWSALAVQLWGDIDRNQLRRRWDMQLQRLRQKLQRAAIRTDLVRSTGNGLVEVVLGPDDTVIDET